MRARRKDTPDCPECGFPLEETKRYYYCTSWNCGKEKLSKKDLTPIVTPVTPVKKMKKEVVKKSVRAETGMMTFGDDWPGIFLRGDSALYYAHVLDLLLTYYCKDEMNAIDKAQITSLQNLLNSCSALIADKSDETQKMKPFKDCTKE